MSCKAYRFHRKNHHYGMKPTAISAICFSSWQSKISKKKNTMSEGGKMIPNNLSLLSSLFGASRMAKILFKPHF